MGARGGPKNVKTAVERGTFHLYLRRSFNKCSICSALHINLLRVIPLSNITQFSTVVQSTAISRDVMHAKPNMNRHAGK